MTTVTEIAPDTFRISTFLAAANLQFNQFLVRDDEPLLFHTGLRGLFPETLAAVAKLIPPQTLRWIGGSHFEADEFGAVNEWLKVAPRAEPLCSLNGALVSLNDVAIRPARGCADGEVVALGRHRLGYQYTPHVPHGWDAGMLFDETTETLFCSDLFHQAGDVEPMFRGDVIGRTRQALRDYQGTPFAWYMPWTPQSFGIFHRLAALRPARLATMHGSTWEGDGARALHDLVGVNVELLGWPAAARR